MTRGYYRRKISMPESGIKRLLLSRLYDKKNIIKKKAIQSEENLIRLEIIQEMVGWLHKEFDFVKKNVKMNALDSEAE